MKRPTCTWAILPMLLALAACTPSPTLMPPLSRHAATCRVGPDGARPIADRGIGGTGTPALRVADRGIGGTGIIGVITGFGSVCVAGEEVALQDGAAVQLDRQPGRIDDLRAGQLVLMAAAGAPGSLQAEVVAVRHEVIGPVQATGSGTLMVAGQMVSVAGATGAAVGARPGAWVAVSGLRQSDGTIVATRVDPAPPGAILVHGELIRVYDTARIGALAIRLPDAANAPGGWPATVTGRMVGEVLMADSATVDIAAGSPSAYFGPTISTYIVESYVAVVSGGYLVDRDFVSGSGVIAGSSGRRILTFTRDAGGGLNATGLRQGSGDSGPAGGFSAAPMPHGDAGGPGGDQSNVGRPSPGLRGQVPGGAPPGSGPGASPGPGPPRH